MRGSAAVFLAATLGSSVFGCAVRERRPEGPYRLAEEFADALSDEVVACIRKSAPGGAGDVAVAAECTVADTPPQIHDLGSLQGSESVVACVRERAAKKLRCPPRAPAPFVRIRAPVPLDTSKVTYAFIHELPSPTADTSPPQP